MYYDDYYMLPSRISIDKINKKQLLDNSEKTARALLELADMFQGDGGVGTELDNLVLLRFQIALCIICATRSDKLLFRCNPNTLALDDAFLRELGSEVVTGQTVNRFPMIMHMENAVLMCA